MYTIDEAGLDEADRRLLIQVVTKHHGGPVGLSTLAATLSEDTITIEEVIEPYLLQIGFLKRTPEQGRHQGCLRSFKVKLTQQNCLDC